MVAAVLEQVGEGLADPAVLGQVDQAKAQVGLERVDELFGRHDGRRGPRGHLPVPREDVVIWRADLKQELSLIGQSVGKRLFGLRIVSTGGTKADFFRVVVLRSMLMNAIPEITEVVDATDHDAGENPFYT